VRGWYIGDPSFKERMQEALEGAVEGRRSESLVGGAKREYTEERGRRILASACRFFGITLEELRLRKYSDLEKQLAPIVPLKLRKGDIELNLFSTIATLGTPQDITAQELRVESFFPADDQTEQTLRRLAGARD